jgi:hypothetical protein
MSGIHKLLHIVVMSYNEERQVTSGHDVKETEIQSDRLRREIGIRGGPAMDLLRLGLAAERWH